MDGFEFLQKFRRDRTFGPQDTPVLIVSARDSDEDQISGLGIGADEYITKPFSPKVLVARVRAVFRRFRDFDKNQGNLFRFGSFVLDYDTCILKKNGERIPLSTKEYGCLSWLTENSGKPMDVETIYKEVWKNNYGDLTTVAVYIQRLRKKIEVDPANPVYIETVHGMGYRFNALDRGYK
jgi:two-component system response regulator RegX3